MIVVAANGFFGNLVPFSPGAVKLVRAATSRNESFLQVAATVGVSAHALGGTTLGHETVRLDSEQSEDDRQKEKRRRALHLESSTGCHCLGRC